MVLLVGFGIAIEGLQSLTSYRTADLYDVFADISGVAGGYLLSLTMLGNLIKILDGYFAGRVE